MAQLMSASRLSTLVAEAVRADKETAVWVSGTGDVLFGRFPNATARLNFGRECLEPCRTSIGKVQQPVGLPIGTGRKTGNYSFVVRGERYDYQNLRHLLSGALSLLEEMTPGVLTALENHKPRSKRVVARKKEALYDDIELVKKFSVEFIPGWFMATNNSAAEVRRYIGLAAAHAGLKPTDFDVET